MKKLIYAALTVFIKLLQDPSPKVKESSAKMLAKCAELYPDTFLNNSNIIADLNIIL